MNSIKFILAIAYFLGIVIFSLGISQDKRENRQGSETIIEVSLDSIKPGSITRKQLINIKGIRITSAGPGGKEISYKIDSCTIALIPRAGNAIFHHLYSNRFKTNLYAEFGNAAPGDHFLLGNLKISGLEKFKLAVPTIWTFVEDKKK